MNESTDMLRSVFRKTDGRCHLTGRKLAFGNYGSFGQRGAWEIEHSVPQSKGGTDHLNNLYPASISANRSKGNSATRTIRSQYGLARAPLSQERKQAVVEKNAWKGLACGALIGLPFGPVGVGLLAALGALIGADTDPE
jgi:5-methylcytosine-specific restriction endonuclease McrA